MSVLGKFSDAYIYYNVCSKAGSLSTIMISNFQLPDQFKKLLQMQTKTQAKDPIGGSSESKDSLHIDAFVDPLKDAALGRTCEYYAATESCREGRLSR